MMNEVCCGEWDRNLFYCYSNLLVLFFLFNIYLLGILFFVLKKIVFDLFVLEMKLINFNKFVFKVYLRFLYKRLCKDFFFINI